METPGAVFRKFFKGGEGKRGDTDNKCPVEGTPISFVGSNVRERSQRSERGHVCITGKVFLWGKEGHGLVDRLIRASPPRIRGKSFCRGLLEQSVGRQPGGKRKRDIWEMGGGKAIDSLRLLHPKDGVGGKSWTWNKFSSSRGKKVSGRKY